MLRVVCFSRARCYLFDQQLFSLNFLRNVNRVGPRPTSTAWALKLYKPYPKVMGKCCGTALWLYMCQYDLTKFRRFDFRNRRFDFRKSHDEVRSSKFKIRNSKFKISRVMSVEIQKQGRHFELRISHFELQTSPPPKEAPSVTRQIGIPLEGTVIFWLFICGS